MQVKEIHAKSLLRQYKKADSWFLARYGFNVYRGCGHRCAYCDGRAEKYQVEGDFDKEVIVKTNAKELLEKELGSKRRRKPLKKGFIVPGGGVGDLYQPLEQKYQMAPQVLKTMHHYGFPIHILTKSNLIERDISLLKEINKDVRVLVSFSFCSADEHQTRIFESGVPSPSERFRAINSLRKEGIHCGAMLMPILPFLSDKHDNIRIFLQQADDSGAEYFIVGGLTLKQGRQKDYYYQTLDKHYPDLKEKYQTIYPDNKWGSPVYESHNTLYETVKELIGQYNLPPRIPQHLFKGQLDENDFISIILEHRAFEETDKTSAKALYFASNVISKLEKNIKEYSLDELNAKGIKSNAIKIIEKTV